MNPRPRDPASSPMRAPPPRLADIVPRVFWRALGSAVAVVLLVHAVLLLVRASQNGRPEDVFTPDLPYRLARDGVVLFLVFLAWFVLARHRPLQDRSFTVFGFLATFFGLGMLLLFFVELGDQVRIYFQVMPRLVAQQNATLKERVERAPQILKEEMAKLDQEEQAELAIAQDDAEKEKIRHDYEERFRPRRRNDLAKTAKEAIVASNLGVRENLSAGALFWHFLTNYPSDKPQDVGIYPALLGSVILAFITILCAVPIGVGAAIYLEEYRTNNWLGWLIQVNINNLAGVPSVVFGILGAFVFVEKIFKPLEAEHRRVVQALAENQHAALGVFDQLLAILPALSPRNVLGGGLTLALLTLPVVIVATQEAIRAVPVSIRQGAYALGATRWQVIWHQVLPMAVPGILTGTILALSRAIGEAAPLVMFGALLYVNEPPSLLSRFTVLPMQIFGWADRPKVEVPGFDDPVEVWQANAGLASVMLLAVLLSLNAVAIYLRNRRQRQMRA